MTKKFSPKQLFISIFAIIFASYLIIGFQPAEATVDYAISSTLEIPEISLSSDVATVQLQNNQLQTPDFIVGSFKRKNKTLLIGHSSTIFQNLHEISIDSQIFYENQIYQVKSKTIIEKNSISMNELLLNTDDTPRSLILMTCIGNSLFGNDSTHRLIIYAEQIYE